MPRAERERKAHENYTGVSTWTRGNTWEANLGIHGLKRYFGSYPTAQEAAPVLDRCVAFRLRAHSMVYLAGAFLGFTLCFACFPVERDVFDHG